MICKKAIIIASVLSIASTLVLADINPKDGNWKPKIISFDVKGCPPMLKSSLKKEKLYSKNQKATFSKPFHPNDIFNPKDLSSKISADIKWVKVSENKWTTLYRVDKMGLSIDMRWNILVTSETTMSMNSNLTINIPKEMSLMLGGSSECKVDSSGIIEHIYN